MIKLLLLTFYLILVISGHAQADTLMNPVELNPVNVRSKLKRPIEIINEKYTSGLFSNMVTSKTFDFVNNPPSHNAGSILEYLQNILNNVTIKRTLEGFEVLTTRGTGSLQNYKKGIQGGGNYVPNSVLLFLDEQPVESHVFFNIHPNDVALVKYFPPGQSQISFNQGKGVLVIYTKKD